MAKVSTSRQPSSTAEDTLAQKSRDESVVSGGHLVAAALKNEGVGHDLHPVRRPYHRYLRRLHRPRHPRGGCAPRAGGGARGRRLRPADGAAGLRGHHRGAGVHQRPDRHRHGVPLGEPGPAHRRPGGSDTAQDGVAAGSSPRGRRRAHYQVLRERAFHRAHRRHGGHGGARVLCRGAGGRATWKFPGTCSTGRSRRTR